MVEMHKHLNPHKMCIDSTKSTSKVFNAQPIFMLCKRTLLMNREPKATLEMILYFAMLFRVEVMKPPKQNWGELIFFLLRNAQFYDFFGSTGTFLCGG